MPYCTQQDLVERFGATELIQLTDRTNRPGTTIDATTVERHVEDATSIIDGYLAARYALPLSAVPTALVKVAADLARYFLHGKAADKDSPIAQAYRDGIRWLEGVSKGVIVIEAAGVVPVVADGGQVRVTDSERPMTVQSMRGYI